MDDPSKDQFTTVWNAALEKYRQISGKDLAQLSEPENIDAFKQEIENSQPEFKNYRNARGSLWSALSAILVLVETLGGAVAGGTSAVFPASSVLIGAISILVKGARGASQSYDYIQNLFDDIKIILARLQIHTCNNISPELRTVFIEILSCILEIIGISTKYVTEKQYLKQTLQPDEDHALDLKQQLVKLVDQGIAMVGALNLGVTVDILFQTTLVESISEGIDEKVDGLAESVQKISVSMQGEILFKIIDMHIV
ncbi:hypothetical protein ABW20_dc0106035 [Dactylellina cionopaga]|nr:hypothetical protein ABW20_dc0106035 [Dactylellina cionopaga]